MAEADCFASNTSLTSNMDREQQQDKKDVSKLFATLRAKLNAKEKELLELQRAQSCLLAPDAEQIHALMNMISSLHLSTQDGSFLFPSTTQTSNESSSTCTCSTGVDTIKTLPSTMWLSEPSVPVKGEEQKNEYRLPMVTHLLSLPVSAYVASPSSRAPPPPPPPVQPKSEPSHRLPMVSQLLSMPLDAFRSPSASSTQSMSDSAPAPVEEKKQAKSNEKDVIASVESTTSIFQAEPTYSKEHWLRRPSSSSSSESDYEHIPLDLDAYIEQSSDKMRRLHTEYLDALNKLKSPAKVEDSTKAIKATYPQMFDRLQQDLSGRSLPRLFPSKK